MAGLHIEVNLKDGRMHRLPMKVSWSPSLTFASAMDAAKQQVLAWSDTHKDGDNWSSVTVIVTR